MTACDGFERGLEIGEGFDTVDLRGLDQRGDPAPCLAALVVPGEERVFSVQRNRADQILDIVAIDLDAAIMQEGLQPVPLVVNVGELFAQP